MTVHRLTTIVTYETYVISSVELCRVSSGARAVNADATWYEFILRYAPFILIGIFLIVWRYPEV